MPTQPNILFTEEHIKFRIRQLAGMISRDYKDRLVTTVTVLESARLFSRHLRHNLQGFDMNVEDLTIKLSSYRGEESSQSIKVGQELNGDIRGKDVLILEDIVDTGITLDFLNDYLLARKPSSVKCCSLINKDARRRMLVYYPDYAGFNAPDKFLVGFGMDKDGEYRELPFIGWVE